MKPLIKPIGIGDLKLVKQELIRYEAGEVAHIENVMATETRIREHRRLRRTEETLTLEEEKTEENSRDLQSTERFEMQQESEKTIKSDTKFEVGAELTVNYGPVKAFGYTKFTKNKSKSETDRSSTSYAKEITDRSINKLTERVRKERITKTIEEFEEFNKHNFENPDGGHKSGIYRWVDKYYRAKVIDYGKRLFYEFTVPEPAAFYIFAKNYERQNNILPKKPLKPFGISILNVFPFIKIHPLSPINITREFYLFYSSLHNAEGVHPPPPEEIVVKRAITRSLDDTDDTEVDQFTSILDEELQIPEGYVLPEDGFLLDVFVEPKDANNYSYHMALAFTGQSEFKKEIDDAILTEDSTDTFIIDKNISGKLPISINMKGIQSVQLNIAIACKLKKEEFEKWQLNTYSALMNAYNKEKLDYEEKLAAVQIQEGVTIGGHNPQINRTIEQEELKKSCINLWTGVGIDFHSSPAMRDGTGEDPPKSFPEINVQNALDMSEEIRFFEQAMDWKNMTYEFYPYYWGRKEKWLDNFSLEDNDPLFQDFLKAGSARVLVPVHLDFSESVLYYQLTGRLWLGGPVPIFHPHDHIGFTIGGTEHSPVNTDEEFLEYESYIAELSGVEAIDDIEKEVEIKKDDPEAWEIKVPTDLVWLQQEESLLPNFETE